MSNPKSRQLTLRKSVIFPFGLLYSTITLRARDFVDYRAIVERAAAARVKIESELLFRYKYTRRSNHYLYPLDTDTL